MQPPQPRQHSDMQMLQRQIMFKQLQEMQRTQQLDEYGDPRQQSYINQLSMLNKQAYGAQLPASVKATPIGDASQIAMVGNTHYMQHGASPIIQGFSQGLVFSQAQSHAMSLYGTPIASGNNLDRYSQIQGGSSNLGNMLSSNFSNSFVSEQFNPSSEQGCSATGAFVPKNVFPVSNSFGQVPLQGSHGEMLSGNFQQMHTIQRNGIMQESMSQDQPGWPDRGTTSLDPLEEKILYNTEDNNWEASLGGLSQSVAGVFDGGADDSSLFPSIQSGSWSALMQSAVAEASSSDTGAQEQWSGSSFQNPELSTTNQPSNYMDIGKQQSNWVDSGMQNIGSPISKPQLQFQDLQMQRNFTGFQQSNNQSMNQRDGVCSDSSHGSLQQSPRNANNWSDCSSRPKHAIDESHLGQVSLQPQNNWPMQHQEHRGSDAQHKSISSYANISQQGYELRGNVGPPGPVILPAVFDRNQPPIQENASATLSGPPCLNSQLQNEHLCVAPVPDQSPRARRPDMASRYPASGSASEDKSNLTGTNPCGQDFPILETMPITQPSATKGVTWKTMAPNPWSAVPTQPSASHSELHSAPSNSLLSADSTSSLQNPAAASQLHRNQSVISEGNDFRRGGATSSSVMTSMLRQAFSKAQQTENRNQTVSAGDFEAFGRSLRPSHGMHQNSPLLHQENSLMNVETDEIDNAHKIAMSTLPNSNITSLSQLNSSSSDDNKLLSLSAEAGPTETESRPARSSVASNTLEQAASWFKHYGAPKEGQVLPMYDTRSAKNVGQQLSAGKSFQNLQLNSSTIQVNSTDASQGSSIWPTMAATPVAGKHLYQLCALPQTLAVLKTKKRKIAALNLLPWHKEVTQGSRRLLNISTAEVKWAKAANRLKEKLEDEAEVIGNVIRVPRAKRRLILTTQLMQQVFQPPPAAILSEAGSNCVSITYFAARSALADACSLTSDSNSNLPSEKLQDPEKPNKRTFSKSVEGFINRAKRLESDLLRMEQRTLFFDMKMESQELDKFYVVNCLAKFHNKGHTASTDSSSSTGSTLIPKPLPQRYVVALPMPRTVPEGANCLSL